MGSMEVLLSIMAMHDLTGGTLAERNPMTDLESAFLQ